MKQVCGISRRKAPHLCMAVGCTGRALYRSGVVNANQSRGYCREHKEMALQRQQEVKKQITAYLLREVEE